MATVANLCSGPADPLGPAQPTSLHNSCPPEVGLLLAMLICNKIHALEQHLLAGSKMIRLGSCNKVSVTARPNLGGITPQQQRLLD
jgi:hypothetical protein